MDTNGTTTNLDTVQDQVIMLSAHLFWRMLEQFKVVGHRRSEGMMCSSQSAVLCGCVLIGRKKREALDPQKVVLVRRNMQQP